MRFDGPGNAPIDFLGFQCRTRLHCCRVEGSTGNHELLRPGTDIPPFLLYVC